MQEALAQAILQETTYKKKGDCASKRKKKDTKTITSGDIFSARTLETRFVLSHYDQRTTNPHHVVSVHRNLLRRGRSPFPKKHNRKYSKHNKRKIKLHTNKSNKLLRYQKRKPFYLLQEKTKHPNSGWLNTHLWHAKRCKMQHLWRYKLSLRNLQHASKSFRSTITQLTTCCTLHDASYWNIIALQAKQNQIIQLLLPFIAPFQRGSDAFTNKEALNGYKECQLYIYRNNCYPFGFLCTVQCCWNAVEMNKTQNDTERVCWIWCHASVYLALFQLLQQIAKDSDVKIRNESRKFVRYELRGSMSSFVLQAASNCAVPVLMDQNSDEYIADGSILCSKMICDPAHYSVSQPFVWNKKVNNKSKSLQFQLKDEFISLHSPAQHPLVLLHQYKANNCRFSDHFHTYLDEKKHMEVDAQTKKKKTRNALYEFPFMMIAKRFYDANDDENTVLRNKIIGWDIIIPAHSQMFKSFKQKAALKFTSITRFWWNNLYFSGGRVIGYEQKRLMRIELNAKQALFPMDYIDCSASVHFWLKYHKYELLKRYFKKPKSKRINPFPLYPFEVWPNALLLFQNKEIMKDSQLSETIIKNNILKIEKQLMNDTVDNDKELQYLLNYTLWGFKADSNIMNHIRLDLKCDVIHNFDANWNQNKHCQYFIVRDSNILSKKVVCDWDESVMNAALVLVKVRMCHKGVPTCGNAMYLNNVLFGYIIDGGYSSIKGCGIGIGIVLLNKLWLSTQHDTISVCPHWNYEEQLHSCAIEVI